MASSKNDHTRANIAAFKYYKGQTEKTWQRTNLQTNGRAGLLKTKKNGFIQDSEQCIKRAFSRPAMPSSSRVPPPPRASVLFVPEQAGLSLKLSKFSESSSPTWRRGRTPSY
jgi:hypothetical protein